MMHAFGQYAKTACGLPLSSTDAATNTPENVTCPACLRLGNCNKATPAEERVTDPETGGQKGTKLARFDLLPAGPLWELAEHYGKGAKKYTDDNWRKGYAWSLSFAALMRHAWAFWRGEDIDLETGTPHIIAVAWHALALAEFRKSHPEKDDRRKS